MLLEMFKELWSYVLYAIDCPPKPKPLPWRWVLRDQWAQEAYDILKEKQMANKEYISAQKLLNDSFQLAINIYKSGFVPNYIVGIWRGGAPVGIAIQELLEYVGIHTDHICIRTSSYDGIESRSKEVRVHGLEYIVKNVNADDLLLIVDDVFDTGLSIQKVIEKLKEQCRRNTPNIQIATPYFKPINNKTNIIPDYYLYETTNWLVFPHELNGLTLDEIIENKSPVVSMNFSK